MVGNYITYPLSTCTCGKSFTEKHAFSCPLVTIRLMHNEICDMTANLTRSLPQYLHLTKLPAHYKRGISTASANTEDSVLSAMASGVIDLIVSAIPLSTCGILPEIMCIPIAQRMMGPLFKVVLLVCTLIQSAQPHCMSSFT